MKKQPSTQHNSPFFWGTESTHNHADFRAASHKCCTLDVYLPFNHLWSFRPLVAPPHCARWPPWSLQLMESLSVNGASQQVTGILPLFFCEPKKRIPYHARHFFRKKTHRKMPTPKPKKKKTCPHLIFDTKVDLLQLVGGFNPLRKIVKMDSSSPRSLVKIKDI